MKRYLVGKAVRNRLLELPFNEEPEYLEVSEADLKNYLQRTDLTIHAIAMDEQSSLVDPFNGMQDIEEGLLRHTSPAFSESPQYILSIAVAGAELSRWGFRVAHGTYGILKKMVSHKAPESFTYEQKRNALQLALENERPSEFFRILHRCGALASISTQLNDLFESSISHREQQLPEAIRLLDKKGTEINKKLEQMLEQDFGYEAPKSCKQ